MFRWLLSLFSSTPVNHEASAYAEAVDFASQHADLLDHSVPAPVLSYDRCAFVVDCHNCRYTHVVTIGA